MGEKKGDGDGVVKDGVYIPFLSGFFFASHVRCNSVGLVFQLGYVLWVFIEFELEDIPVKLRLAAV